MTLLALCSLESDLETFLTIHCYSFLYVLYMYLSAYCLSFPKIYFVHIISIDKLKKCEKYRFPWYSVILKLVSFYLCNCHSLFFYCGTEIFLILTILQMDFMVVKKINYKIEKKQQQLFLCKCKNIWRIFFFLDIQDGSIIPIVCCPADTNKLTSTEYFHNPSSLTDVKNDFLTFTLQLPHDKTVSDGLYSFITQGEITRLNIESLLIRLFFFTPSHFFLDIIIFIMLSPS